MSHPQFHFQALKRGYGQFEGRSCVVLCLEEARQVSGLGCP